MAARPDLDLATGAEKGEIDAALLTLVDRATLLVPLDFSAILSWPIALLGANNSPFLSVFALFLVDPRQTWEWDAWYVFGVDDVINEIETGS
jgi:hypothetical protein